MHHSRLGDADERSMRLAKGQFGLIAAAQAFAVGHTRASLSRRVKQGKLIRILPGVYAIAGAPSSWEQDAMAAHLWAGDATCLSHGAAARKWSFEGFESAGVEISAVGERRHAVVPFTCHRVNRFLMPEIERIQNLPVTSVRRTLLDLAGVRHPRHERALDEALRKELTSLGQMWLLYEEEWTRGRRGIRILRDLLVHRTPGRAPSQRDVEELFLEIVEDFQLPEPIRQHPVRLPFGVVHVDFAYPGEGVVIETDGYAHHSERRAFDDDRERDAELQAIGLRPLRFTWAKLKFRREWVAETVCRVLAEQGRHRAANESRLA
jgi:very-short-patch-repair endonuclease